MMLLDQYTAFFQRCVGVGLCYRKSRVATLPAQTRPLDALLRSFGILVMRGWFFLLWRNVDFRFRVLISIAYSSVWGRHYRLF